MKRLIDFLKNNRKWNVFLSVFMIVFLCSGLIIVQNREQNVKLSSILIEIEPKDELAFLDQAKVLELIGKGLVLNNHISLGDINIDRMESDLEAYPFIELADVSTDLGGRLIVKVLQRYPVLRIFSNRGQSYYVSKNGFKMPLHPGFTPRVLCASGEIGENLTDSTSLSTELCRSLLNIAMICNRDPFWHAQIEQLYVDNYMDILLIPKIGNHSIVFGSGEHPEDKFRLLRNFYTNGLNACGWDKYSRIDLRFEGQVVASKKTNTQNAATTQP